MLPKDAKICISTQHPGQGGGVGRQVDLLTDYLYNKGYNPKVMFSSNIKKNLFFNEEFVPYNKKITKNIITTKTYIPFYWPNYQIYGNIMNKRVKNFDVCHQIGGSCLEAVPFLKAQKKYVCWVATTFRDEWNTVTNFRDYSRPFSWALRLTNHLSLPAIRNIERKIYQNASIINPVSERSADLIKSEFKIPSEKIKVMPNPIDLKRFQGKIRHKFYFDYVLFVGRLDRRKNLEVLLRAFKDLEQKELKLVIFGDGPERLHLEQEATNLGISKNVIFTGFMPDDVKIDYLKQARVFALTSKQEGFGIAIIEAMACGIPVVSTDCGGPRDIIQDGTNGFLVKIGDHHKIAQRIKQLLQDDVLRKRTVIEATNSIKKFDIDEVGQKILKEYKSII